MVQETGSTRFFDDGSKDSGLTRPLSGTSSYGVLPGSALPADVPFVGGGIDGAQCHGDHGGI